MNNFSISSGGLGEALQRSASALSAAGNTLDESIALITAANKVAQDPASVGTMLKTVSMRIRGMKVELEEAGLDTEGMVESTSKLRDVVKELSRTDGNPLGVDIMEIKNGEEVFRSTYAIMTDLANVWDEISNKNQAALLEKLAGARQGNYVAAMLSNVEDLEDVIETTTNAAGSAGREYEKYLDSAEAKQKQMKAAYQDLSQSLVNSELVKFVYDTSTGFLGFLTMITEKVGALPTLLSAASAVLSGYKNFGISNVNMPYPACYGAVA